MSETSLSAARIIAKAVGNHFEKYKLSIHDFSSTVISLQPDLAVIEAIVNAGFWASLRREEGRSPKISLAYLSPNQCQNPLIFERKLPLNPKILTKLGPGVERRGIHLGIWQENGQLYIWGTTQQVPPLCFILELVEPGLLVVKHRRFQGFGKFVNVAILDGDAVKIVAEETAGMPDCPALVSTMLGLNTSASWNTSTNILVQLAASMRSHGRGGTLLVAPDGNDDWKQSMVEPITYPIAPSFCGLADLLNQDRNENDELNWQTALNREVAHVAGLTAIDGATVINSKCDLLAFGAKIQRKKGAERIDQILVTEPILGNKPKIAHPSIAGGTRHLSAAQFVLDQKDSIALVASQDGRFTVFAWSPCENIVHAHRVDTLLL